jgi:thiazole synthase ThiGH ThiG subunit
MNVLTQVLPVDIVLAMINGDESGLTDQESLELLEYSEDLNRSGFYAIPFTPEKEQEYYTSNDLNNVGCDCLMVEFQELPNK